MRVRIARPEDEEQLLELCRLAAAETVPHLQFDADRMLLTIQNGIDSGSPIFFVADHDGQVVGFLMAFAVPYCFAAGVFAQQEVFYVHPDKRGSRAAALLVAAFCQWADRLGANEIFFGISNGYHPDRTARLFERFGAKRTGYALKIIRSGG